MSEVYFTIAGTNHWHGQEFIEPGMKVKLVKEPDNEDEATTLIKFRIKQSQLRGQLFAFLQKLPP